MREGCAGMSTGVPTPIGDGDGNGKRGLILESEAVENWREYRNRTLHGLGIKERVAENDRQ